MYELYMNAYMYECIYFNLPHVEPFYAQMYLSVWQTGQGLMRYAPSGPKHTQSEEHTFIKVSISVIFERWLF